MFFYSTVLNSSKLLLIGPLMQEVRLVVLENYVWKPRSLINISLFGFSAYQDSQTKILIIFLLKIPTLVKGCRLGPCCKIYSCSYGEK